MRTFVPRKQKQGKGSKYSTFFPGIKQNEYVFFQPKLTIGPVDDVYEKEADAMADRVMRMTHGEEKTVQPQISSVDVQRKCPACEEEEKAQRKEKVFNEGQYAPESENGKRILAHELTHVVQQQTNTIQRTIRRGQDYAGSYEFDDSACTFHYNQDWYFSFLSGMGVPLQTAYMARAENQVEGVWSHQHHLVPSTSGCPCQDPGVDVSVNLNTFNESRRDRHGYDVDVTNAPTTGFTNQPARDVTLSDTHNVPVNMGRGLTQQRIAHEFGHTLGITDEYHWWASLWNTFGHSDRSSIMHSGDDVRPRHYQHFADLISNEIEGCQYRPEGFSSRALANPVARLGLTGALTLDNADFILDLHIDRRLGNTDFLGLATPRLGFSALFNAANGNVMFGPTFSLSLNRIAHPVYVDVATGLFYDPEDPGRPASLNIPASATVGIRGDGFSTGINYTGLIDVLGNHGYTHMIGLNLRFDIGDVN